MARVAIYARYSSDLQNPRSIEDQEALCRRWCEREGHGVVATFSDAALSGASIHGRSGLKSMIAGAVERQFDVVVVESFDRVARSQSELPQVWEMLRFCGCELIAVDDGRASEISIGVRGLVGALYLTDLASKTRRGLAGKLAQGQRAGGLPYGYRPIVGRPGEHEIDRDQAAVVLRIFRDYAEGSTCREIAAALNHEEVKPFRGRAWNASTIHGSAKRASGMICNEIYRGVIIWNRVGKIRNPQTGRKVPRVNPRSEWHRTEAPHLRIVPEELWQETAARLAKARNAHCGWKGVPPRRILSGLLRCGACGSSLVSAGSQRGRPMARCSRSIESGDCTNSRQCRLDRIEEAVLGGLREELKNPAVIEAARRGFAEEWARLSKERSRESAAAERKLQDARREAARLVDAVAKGEMTGRMVGAKLAELEAEIDRQEARLVRATEENVVALHPATIAVYLNAVEQLAKALSASDAKAACLKLRELIDCIVVAPRVGPGDPIHFEVRGRLAALMQPDPGKVSVRALVPRGGIEPPTLRFSGSFSINRISTLENETCLIG
jgi:DNA invertase Pin-like site-specific DNA recombinase